VPYAEITATDRSNLTVEKLFASPIGKTFAFISWLYGAVMLVIAAVHPVSHYFLLFAVGFLLILVVFFQIDRIALLKKVSESESKIGELEGTAKRAESEERETALMLQGSRHALESVQAELATARSMPANLNLAEPGDHYETSASITTQSGQMVVKQERIPKTSETT
jgi:hypothetical protein